MAMTDVKAVDIQTASRVANKVSEYGHQARMTSENINAKTAQTNGNVVARRRSRDKENHLYLPRFLRLRSFPMPKLGQQKDVSLAKLLAQWCTGLHGHGSLTEKSPSCSVINVPDENTMFPQIGQRELSLHKTCPRLSK